jgi:hypothetical protein
VEAVVLVVVEEVAWVVEVVLVEERAVVLELEVERAEVPVVDLEEEEGSVEEVVPGEVSEVAMAVVSVVGRELEEEPVVG